MQMWGGSNQKKNGGLDLYIISLIMIEEGSALLDDEFISNARGTNRSRCAISKVGFVSTLCKASTYRARLMI